MIRLRELLPLIGLLFFAFSGANAQTTTHAPLDFDGDGKTDHTVTRIENELLVWYVKPSTGAPDYAVQWGVSGDVATPADYDGDGKTDIAVWRPTLLSAYFYILESATGAVRVTEFGLIGDDPSVVADYDGDGRADLAVYRNAAPGGQSYFYYLGSANNPNDNITFVPWGAAGDLPATGDFDGDGRADFVVQRSEAGAGVFYLWQSTNGFAVFNYGLPTDLAAFADYDGDGKTDFAVVRAENLNYRWWIRRSIDGAIVNVPFGLSRNDFVTPGDYNGDRLADIAVWRPSVDPAQCFFYSRALVVPAVARVEWGIGTDYPAASFNVH
ncbi:MAG: VCBS repeat-containing protein [Acidobacteria bacterium]|nr:VCBS repeat-containing protein [Acidobacteriota bacterium]